MFGSILSNIIFLYEAYGAWSSAWKLYHKNFNGNLMIVMIAFIFSNILSLMCLCFLFYFIKILILYCLLFSLIKIKDVLTTLNKFHLNNWIYSETPRLYICRSYIHSNFVYYMWQYSITLISKYSIYPSIISGHTNSIFQMKKDLTCISSLFNTKTYRNRQTNHLHYM